MKPQLSIRQTDTVRTTPCLSSCTYSSWLSKPIGEKTHKFDVTFMLFSDLDSQVRCNGLLKNSKGHFSALSLLHRFFTHLSPLIQSTFYSLLLWQSFFILSFNIFSRSISRLALSSLIRLGGKFQTWLSSTRDTKILIFFQQYHNRLSTKSS